MNMSKSDVDFGFYLAARRALSNARTSAIEFAAKNPRASKIELAKQLGHGVTARGLTIALFQEANTSKQTRELAIDLLFREIIAEFPDGWYLDDKVRNTVKLGSWYYDVLSFSPNYGDAAAKILKDLCISNPPETGWLPESKDDQRLRLVFEKYWKNS